MFKGIIFLLCFPLTQQLPAYPQRHKIAKNIHHKTKTKSHPCRLSLDMRDRPFPVLTYLQNFLVDVLRSKQHIVCRMDDNCSERMLTIGEAGFTTFEMSALCGEEILYDMSLVLEHFYREFTMRSAELDTLISTGRVFKNDTLKSLLNEVQNDIRDAVMSFRPDATDPFVAYGNDHKVKGRVTEIELLKRYTSTILDFEHFVKSAVSIIKLK